ncbi:MAG: NAD(P)/FAD-dependent oxidoreductase, partial [Gammaproteobacteria bacterium]|nr:NAD(P)/FAD-dependent oxidoreductase [Gammaproteobacteria bacterium]
GECIGFRLVEGTEITAKQAVVSALDPYQTFLQGFEEGVLSSDFLRMVRNFSFGNITIVRVHYALHEPPRFRNGTEMDRTPFQRVFGKPADIDRQYREIAAGIPPSDPFLWTACWTLMDPTRAPPGKHTLIMDTFVSMDRADGADWEATGPAYVREVMLRQLRSYTTNSWEENIIAEYVETGPSLARANLCFYRGSTTGGERTLAQTGAFRPFPNYAGYRGPLKKLYLTGPSCHPGGGICGMGTITANEILLDLGLREEDDDLEL